jgi:hypothetical protein
MGLLVWIKSICNQYDAPTTAYACGQTEVSAPLSPFTHLPLR